MNSKLNAALHAADAADNYEAIIDRRQAARSRESWCDCCKTWVEKKSMAQHLTTDEHAAAWRKADAWKM